MKAPSSRGKNEITPAGSAFAALTRLSAGTVRRQAKVSVAFKHPTLSTTRSGRDRKSGAHNPSAEQTLCVSAVSVELEEHGDRSCALAPAIVMPSAPEVNGWQMNTILTW